MIVLIIPYIASPITVVKEGCDHCLSRQVRKTAADQLYTVLLTYDELLPEDVLDHVVIMLADTTW